MTSGDAGRHHRSPEPEARRLGQPPLGVGDLADLARETELAHQHEIGGDRPLGDGAGDGEGHGEVGAGLEQADAAHGGRVHVVVAEAQAGVTLEHRQQQGEPAAVEPVGVAPDRHLVRHRHGERLDLDEQRPRAVHRRRDDRPGHAAPAIGEEQLATRRARR